MMERPDELEALKTRVNLTEYAAAQGYFLDRQKSSRNSAIMKNPETGDKIIIAVDTDQHWIYFSVGTDGDSGSIIDFVMNKQGGTIGHARKELRPWLYTGPSSPALLRPSPDAFLPLLEPIKKDLLQVRAWFEDMEQIDGKHPYLQRERCIPAYVLADARFQRRIYTDKFRNAIFPHWKQDALTGYEIKNNGFTGFAKGGQKTLWRSLAAHGDRALVISEKGIDALSYHTLKLPKLTRYISTAGTMNPEQPELIRIEMEKMQPGAKIINATDNDEGGDELTEKLREIHAKIKNRDYEFVDDRPARRKDDWNDVLKSSVAAAATARPSAATSSALPAAYARRHRSPQPDDAP